MPQRPRRGLAVWLTASRTPVFVLDDRRVILVFNAGCEELTQWSAADLIGKPCLYQNEPNPDCVTSLTGALCPPVEVQPHQVVRQRTVIHQKNGNIIERDVHFFRLEPGDESGGHTLGVITECSETVPVAETPHLEVSRHTALLYARYGIDRLIIQSPAMQRVAAQIDLARHQTASVHLTGERGTGREHIARLIHYTSNLSSQRFVPLRCATASHFEISRVLHQLNEPGQNEDVGTVYFDDIPSLPADLQLLVLEQCERADRRVISSSPIGLEGVCEEHFPPLLVARLCCLTIRVPPLRERGLDLPLLAQQLLEECNVAAGLQHTEFSPSVLRLFQKYPWPGNVKELTSVITKACERSESPVVDVDDLPMEFNATLHARAIRPVQHPVSLEEQLTHFERTLIQEALKETRGNKSLAAERLSMPRAKLYRRLEQLGLGESINNGEAANLAET